MGEVISFDPVELAEGISVELSTEVAGWKPIRHILLFRNGKIIDKYQGYGREAGHSFTDVFRSGDCFEKAGGKFVYYYIRVEQTDGHMAWSSPIWFWEKQR